MKEASKNKLKKNITIAELNKALLKMSKLVFILNFINHTGSTLKMISMK